METLFVTMADVVANARVTLADVIANSRLLQALNLKKLRKDEACAENVDYVDHMKVSQAASSEGTRKDKGCLENTEVPQSLTFEESENDKVSVEIAEVLQGLETEYYKDSLENAEVLQGLEAGNYVGWGNMVHELLVEIFMRLSCKDRLQFVQLVCKSWKASAWDRSCWEVVHMDQLCTETIRMVTKERVLKLIVARCEGSIHELIFPSIRFQGLLCLLREGAYSSLKTLRIPLAAICNDSICELVLRLPALSCLDVSECYVTAEEIKVIGENCKGLTKFTRRDVSRWKSICSWGDYEAEVISEYMPKLRYLDISGARLSNAGLLAILEKCRDLETVVLLGCDDVDIHDESFERRIASMQLKVKLIDDNNSSSISFIEDVHDNYNVEDSDDDYPFNGYCLGDGAYGDYVSDDDSECSR